MEEYKSKNGNTSGVVAYEIEDKSVTLAYKNGKSYTYTEQSCGHQHIKMMIELLAKSEGISTYISDYRPNYASKRMDISKQ